MMWSFWDVKYKHDLMHNYQTFQVSKIGKQLVISFSSTMENIDKIDLETRMLLKNKLSDSQIFAVCLSSREGLTNAIKHGHLSKADKTIRYTLTLAADRLIIEIEDQGDGFDWKKTCQKKPNPELDHGRGLTIIREYSSDFSYNERGNKLTMVFDKH